MLRLRPFELHHPTTVDEAVALLASHGKRARLISGGTDVLPNLKLGSIDAEVVVSLSRVDGLTGVQEAGGEVVIGARTRLIDVATDPTIGRIAPALAEAASRIASPQIRRMGTIGGNLLLDVRCRYINQSDLFRQALGGCLKSHGAECHVVPGGRTCVAALSADTVPVLVALGASVDLVGGIRPRRVPVVDLYGPEGRNHLKLTANEVLIAIRFDAPAATTAVVWRKWAVRKSIDFPLVSVAVRLDRGADGLVSGGLAVAVVLGPQPRVVPFGLFAGRPVDAALAEEIGALVERRCTPMPNVPYDAAYRKRRLGVEVKRAVLAIRDADA